MESNSAVAEVPEIESVQEDYFGTDKTHRVTLPDGMSWIEHKELNEGERRKYMNATNRDVRIARQTGDMHLRMAAGDERAELLKVAIVGWNLQSGGQPLDFNDANLRRFLEKASPKIVDIVEKDIRKKNPWLVSDVSVEDIDKQIEELQELREQKLKEDSGKDG